MNNSTWPTNKFYKFTENVKREAKEDDTLANNIKSFAYFL